MIKLISVVEVLKNSKSETIRKMNEDYNKAVETAQDFGMKAPDRPSIEIEEEDLEEVKYVEYINPDDIKKMTRVGGRTILTMYDQSVMVVIETPSKIQKLKHDYNEKHPSNNIRIYNFNMHSPIPHTGGFQSSNDLDDY